LNGEFTSAGVAMVIRTFGLAGDPGKDKGFSGDFEDCVSAIAIGACDALRDGESGHAMEAGDLSFIGIADFDRLFA